jgi:hypothetical protein
MFMPLHPVDFYADTIFSQTSIESALLPGDHPPRCDSDSDTGDLAAWAWPDPPDLPRPLWLPCGGADDGAGEPGGAAPPPAAAAAALLPLPRAPNPPRGC